MKGLFTPEAVLTHRLRTTALDYKQVGRDYHEGPLDIFLVSPRKTMFIVTEDSGTSGSPFLLLDRNFPIGWQQLPSGGIQGSEHETSLPVSNLAHPVGSLMSRLAGRSSVLVDGTLGWHGSNGSASDSQSGDEDI